MKQTRKDFLKSIGFLGVTAVSGKLANSRQNIIHKVQNAPPICTLVPSETLGPFPSLPSGDTMYWREDITDGQAGVPFSFTIRVNGDNNCGVMVGRRVDVWHCNADGFYSHYASGGVNNGHSGNNTPSNNASLIYCRGTQITNSQGEVTFYSIFPGWYPGRTCHIHFAIYSGGTPGTSSGWVLDRVSQFTFPITEKNALYVANAPYSTYGADPLHPDNDNVFNSPAGQWSSYQLGTLVGAGNYSSYYELAIDATGALPLDLLGFEGALHGTSSLLWWKTASEINFSHFELEYSEDGEDFSQITTVGSKGNNAQTSNYYEYVDKDRILFGNAYYRLKMVDFDGTFKYSSVIVVKYNIDLPLRIYPNPATDVLNIVHPLTNGVEKILIMDMQGKYIAEGALTASTNQTIVPLDLLNQGMYYLVYADGYNNQSIKFYKH